jgi:hypothetical protein
MRASIAHTLIDDPTDQWKILATGRQASPDIGHRVLSTIDNHLAQQ